MGFFNTIVKAMRQILQQKIGQGFPCFLTSFPCVHVCRHHRWQEPWTHRVPGMSEGTNWVGGRKTTSILGFGYYGIKRLPIRFRATQRCWWFALLWAQSTSERIESRWVPCPSLALHLHEQGMVCTGPVHFQGGSHRLDGTGPSVDTWSKIWWTSPCIQTLASKRTHQASGLGENSAIAHPSPEEQS